MPSRTITAAVAALAVLLAGSATACSSNGTSTALGMQSLCRDYLGKPQDVQNAAVQRIAGAQHNGEALTPLGRPNVDYFCGNNPNMKLADAVARAGGKSIAPTTSATGAASSPTCTGPCFTNPAEVQAALDAATKALPAMLDRDYRKLDAEHTAALAVIAPTPFRSEFDSTWTSLEPLVIQQHAVQTWKTSTRGIVSLSGSTAVVLVYGQNETTNSTTPTPRTDLSTVLVSLQRSNDTWLVSKLDEIGAGSSNSATSVDVGNAQLGKAVGSARQEALALTTYSRAHFDADYARALAGATGSLLSDMNAAGRRDQLLNAMTSGTYDLQGTVTALAVESVTPTEVKVLAAVSSKQLVDGNAASGTLTTSRFELTLVPSAGSWLVSDLKTVGLS